MSDNKHDRVDGGSDARDSARRDRGEAMGAPQGGALVPTGPVRDVGARRQGGIRLEPWQVEEVARVFVRGGDASVAVMRARVREYRWPFAVVVRRVMELPEVVAEVSRLRAAGVVGVVGSDDGRLTREVAEEKLAQWVEDAERAGEIEKGLRVLALWGKWNGLETQKVEVTHRKGVTEMTDAELEEAVRRRMAEMSVVPDADGGGDGR